MDLEVLATLEKPVLDEDAFQQLLAAAYVIQQQMDDLRRAQQFAPGPSEAKPGSEDALAIIAETQERLRSRTWDIALAARLVAEGLQRIIYAEGIAIAVERAGMLEYVSATGAASSLAGVSFPMPADLPLVSAGAETAQEVSLSVVRQTAGEQSDIALPLFHDGKVAGILEIRFGSGRATQESDLRCCQLMAGLMTEAIARAAEAEWKQAIAAERATMLEELERIMPQVGGPIPAPLDELRLPASIAAPTQSAALEPPGTSDETGKAEASRDRAGSPAKRRRSERSERRRAQAGERPAPTRPGEDRDVIPVPMEAQVPTAPDAQPVPLSSAETVEHGEGNKAISVPAVFPPRKEVWDPWISSARAKQWLESLQANGPARRWLDVHRADLYLAAAVLMLVLSLGWLARSSHSAMAQSRNPAPTLSLFERVLVALDLAEPPVTPLYPGNPNTRVWVDLHTALYYCPGAELYGKTAGGKFTTQHDAQIDQFQPAERKSCN